MASHIQEFHHPYAKQHACMHATYGETESSGFPSPHQKQHQVNIKKTSRNIQMPKTLSTHHLVYLLRAQINLPNLTNTKKKGTLSSIIKDVDNEPCTCVGSRRRKGLHNEEGNLTSCLYTFLFPCIVQTLRACSPRY
jgi:hypothetical protein